MLLLGLLCAGDGENEELGDLYGPGSFKKIDVVRRFEGISLQRNLCLVKL